jgi:glycine cleavage system H protein
MSNPDDRRYMETHEWFKTDGDVVTMGISQFAADELTDITFVELPKVGTQVAAGKACGEIESVKATSELFCAVSGEVIEINETLNDNPELVNEDAFDKGWMFKIRATDLDALESLMDATAYNAHVG